MRMWFDAAGAIHFHSSYSYDAVAPLEEMIQAAFESGLEFGILTDHFTLQARADGHEKTYTQNQKTFHLFVGEEISPRYNHYLALGIQHPILVSKEEMNAQSVIDQVRAQGGMGFIAHPDHSGGPLLGIRAFPWVEWNVKGFTGISVWDLLGDWARTLTSYSQIFKSFLWPIFSLQGPCPETLKRWDTLCQHEHVPIIGELDNHATAKSFFGFQKKIFPYALAFRSIRTHVLLTEALSTTWETAQQQIYEALRLGRSYVSLDYWKNPKGFSFQMTDGDQTKTMGDTFLLQNKPSHLHVHVPEAATIRLFRDGRLVAQVSNKVGLEQDVDLPGVYRVEVLQSIWGQKKPWIFSNPIWVQKE